MRGRDRKGLWVPDVSRAWSATGHQGLVVDDDVDDGDVVEDVAEADADEELSILSISWRCFSVSPLVVDADADEDGLGEDDADADAEGEDVEDDPASEEDPLIASRISDVSLREVEAFDSMVFLTAGRIAPEAVRASSKRASVCSCCTSSEDRSGSERDAADRFEDRAAAA